MSKTPEETAEEYANLCVSDAYYAPLKAGFLAGYKAAENHFRDATEKVGPQWISVKDRLPEIYQRVLILIRGRIFISSIEEEYGGEYRDGVIRFWDGDWDWPEVTHWMPLPAPPKEDK
jgi:hypothetical protein